MDINSLESVVPMLVTLFQMQRLTIVCNSNGTNLDWKRNLFRDAPTIKLIKSVSHAHKRDIMESNLIICASRVSQDEIAGLMKGTYALNYPWVIVHHKDDEMFLPSSGINQQVYFYNEFTGTLYEKYSVNSVTVTRQLDIRHRLDDVYKRRADMHGLNLNVAVSSWDQLYGVRSKDKTDIITLPSGDKFIRLSGEETFGMLEDLLIVLARELNFTVR